MNMLIVMFVVFFVLCLVINQGIDINNEMVFNYIVIYENCFVQVM